MGVPAQTTKLGFRHEGELKYFPLEVSKFQKKSIDDKKKMIQNKKKLVEKKKSWSRKKKVD